MSLDENLVKLAVGQTGPVPKGETRSREEAEDNLVEMVKHAKIARVSPSKLADLAWRSGGMLHRPPQIAYTVL